MAGWLHSLAFLLHLAHPVTPCTGLAVGGELPAVTAVEWQEQTTLLCNESYAVLVSAITHGPLWSAEHLTREAVSQLPYMPRLGEFQPDARLPPDRRTELWDFTHSGYDRGHMTPSGDMPDPSQQQETFLLSNVVPQTEALNRHRWEHLEARVRAIASRFGEVYVVTGPAFEEASVRSIGPDRVWVPDETWKAIYVPGVGSVVTICANTSAPSCREMSVASLMELVGVDPFPGVGALTKSTIVPLAGGRHRGS